MRTEAGKMPESLILPIGNESGVSNDRFGFNPNRPLGFWGIFRLCQQDASGLAEGLAGHVEA